MFNVVLLFDQVGIQFFISLPRFEFSIDMMVPKVAVNINLPLSDQSDLSTKRAHVYFDTLSHFLWMLGLSKYEYFVNMSVCIKCMVGVYLYLR